MGVRVFFWLPRVLFGISGVSKEVRSIVVGHQLTLPLTKLSQQTESLVWSWVVVVRFVVVTVSECSHPGGVFCCKFWIELGVCGLD